MDSVNRANLSGWLFHRNAEGSVPTLTREFVKTVLARRLPPISERADFLLLEAIKYQSRLGDRFNINEPRFVAATYSQDAEEVSYLLRMLSDRGLMQATALGGKCEIMPGGYVEADSLARRTGPSDKGFVAMSFHESLDGAYRNGLQVGIMNAGYDPVRVDRIEHTNRIDDEIIAQIRVSSFVVADFTGHRGGVYFEAGFALGLDLPVIWTCRKDDMAHLHFDIRQYNTIDWETPENLASRLQRRIEATVGKGPKTLLDS
ncbi:MAG: hypothetical protein OXC26_16955 [Albidovulum sp.]|nr:hypothetical protein [Albidovulum sp.]